MMIVPTRIRPSSIEGVGLFAASPIKAGTPVWEFHPTFDYSVAPGALDQVPEQIRRLVFSHGFLNQADGIWYLNLDNARFANHSATPNIESDGVYMVANRNIAADEELTCDYFSYYTANPHQPWLASLPRAPVAGPRIVIA